MDDYEPFRRFVRSTLGKRPELQIVGEVSDGLDAVQKAEELQPDLILLDIGLPTLNGIDAARQIRKLSPTSNIIFVTQESSADMVQEAFDLGASGYLVKFDSGSELLAAVTAVLRGEHFVGSRFAGHNFVGTSNLRTADALFRKKLLASRAPTLPRTAQSIQSHEVMFYSDDECFLDSSTQFIGAALKAGNAVIVVATESHRNGLLPRLQAHGLDIGAAIEQGRYISLDVAETVSTIMTNDLPDPGKFLRVTGNLIAEARLAGARRRARAAKAAKVEPARVAACGECAPLLWAQGKAEAAIRLEHLWDEIAKSHGLDVLCAYPLSSFQGGMESHIFQRICAEHSAVYSR